MKFLRKTGFTLIEILVVISIISIVAVVTVTALGIGKEKNNLKTAQKEIVAAIKLTQSYALQGKTVPSGDAPCGFGFLFSDRTHFKIFYIESGNGLTCDEKNEDSNYRQYIDESDSPILEEFELKNNVVLGEEVSFSDTEIYFSLPHSNIYGSSGETFGGTAITLTNIEGSESRTIVVNAKGIISES